MKSVIHGTAEGDGNDIRDIIWDKFSICSSNGVQYNGCRALSQQPRSSTKTLQYKCHLIAASTECLMLRFLGGGVFRFVKLFFLMSHRQTTSLWEHFHSQSSVPPRGSAALRRPPPECCGCGCRWEETSRASPPLAGTAAPALLKEAQEKEKGMALKQRQKKKMTGEQRMFTSMLILFRRVPAFLICNH